MDRKIDKKNPYIYTWWEFCFVEQTDSYSVLQTGSPLLQGSILTSGFLYTVCSSVVQCLVKQLSILVQFPVGVNYLVNYGPVSIEMLQILMVVLKATWSYMQTQMQNIFTTMGAHFFKDNIKDQNTTKFCKKKTFLFHNFARRRQTQIYEVRRS